tara:strand:+ start:227 stop:439 length:213 start_codon:yes stop_codon:yes gene_type:complete
MFFTIGLVVIFILVVILIFAYQKIYNPGKLCHVCYRVVPEMVFVEASDEEGVLDYYEKCPFCDSELEWGD